jgi:3-oxoacyl-[acyl-carrier-protein] synthase-3
MKTGIRAVDFLLPEGVLTNEVLAEQFNTSADRIFRATGIRNRHILPEGMIASDLAIAAASAFLSRNHIQKNEIDFIIFCSHGFDYKGGVTSALIHHALQLSLNCGVLDLPQGCSGYIYGLFLADSMIRSGNCRKILFIAADMPSTVLHPDDYELRILFGDAASVTLLEKTDSGGIGKFILGTDGGGFYNLFVDGSHSRNPVDTTWLDTYAAKGGLLRGRMKMNSAEIFHFSLNTVPGLYYDILAANNMVMENLDGVIFHQANGFMLEKLRKKLNIPQEKFLMSMENTGNTVASTIPIVMANAIKNERIGKGSKILVAGFGIGYCWGGTIIEL